MNPILCNRRLLITASIVVFAVAACKKSSGPVFTADVYVAGNLSGANGPQAIYWKNNVSFPLASPNQHGLVNAIAVSGMDVYFAGETFNSTDSFVTTYWKNGAATTLPVPGTNGQANSIAVSGANVYVAGFTVNSRINGIGNPEPLLWKNNVADTLPLPGSYGQPMSVAVAGSDVYVTGNGTNVPNAVYWKNGALTIVSRGYTFASGIAVSGPDVYIAGDSNNGTGALIPACWKDGTSVPFSANVQVGVAGHANSIIVSGSDVYVVGYTYSANGSGAMVATYWKNGVPVLLGYGMATGIAVDGSDVYVSGNTYTNNSGYYPVYWKNGIVTKLPGNGSANAIAVIPHQ